MTARDLIPSYLVQKIREAARMGKTEASRSTLFDGVNHWSDLDELSPLLDWLDGQTNHSTAKGET